MAASAEHSIKLLGNVLEVPTPRVVLFWIRKHKSTAVLGRHGLVWVENRPKRIQMVSEPLWTTSGPLLDQFSTHFGSVWQFWVALGFVLALVDQPGPLVCLGHDLSPIVKMHLELRALQHSSFALMVGFVDLQPKAFRPSCSQRSCLAQLGRFFA